MIRVMAFLLGGVVVVSSNYPSFAQISHCDPNLPTASDDPYGYRLRGDRCEGLYINEVAATLRVASLTSSLADFTPTSSRNLLIEWTAIGNQPVHLRANSLRERLYYQMDSFRPTASASYSWPTDLLAALGLGRSDLGLTASTSYQVGNTKREVFLPIRIKGQSATTKTRNYQLVLLPGVELAEVFMSLAPVKDDGSLGPFIIKDQAQQSGYNAANRTLTIRIPEVTSSGIYYLEIGAVLRTRGSTSIQVWFYHQNN
jgi:hypothetical protein